jgi:hypothetical protein
MAALPCCAQKDGGSRSAALRFDWPVYPRRAEHNTVAEGGNRRWADCVQTRLAQHWGLPNTHAMVVLVRIVGCSLECPYKCEPPSSEDNRDGGCKVRLFRVRVSFVMGGSLHSLKAERALPATCQTRTRRYELANDVTAAATSLLLPGQSSDFRCHLNEAPVRDMYFPTGSPERARIDAVMRTIRSEARCGGSQIDAPDIIGLRQRLPPSCPGAALAAMTPRVGSAMAGKILRNRPFTEAVIARRANPLTPLDLARTIAGYAGSEQAQSNELDAPIQVQEQSLDGPSTRTKFHQDAVRPRSLRSRRVAHDLAVAQAHARSRSDRRLSAFPTTQKRERRARCGGEHCNCSATMTEKRSTPSFIASRARSKKTNGRRSAASRRIAANETLIGRAVAFVAAAQCF